MGRHKKVDRAMEHHKLITTVVVLDRHALFRRGVVALLRDAHPEWHCSDADSLHALDPILGTRTNVLMLVDLGHPDILAAGGLEAMITAYPTHIFASLSDEDDRGTVLGCLTAGARGYILRSTNTTQFVRALETLVDGAIYAPVALTAAPRSATEASAAATLATLTDRQRDVFNLLAEGCATKTIARRLDLAVGTVKVHLAAIYRALGANSRLEAVAKAHRLYVIG